MGFSRGQVQILYNYLPGAIFPHDDYGFCKVTRVDLETGIQVNVQAVLEAVTDTLHLWQEDWQRIGFPEPRNSQLDQNDFVIGRPTRVYFEPYPQMLQCQQCQRVYHLRDLLQHNVPRQCPAPGCGGRLMQFRFVQAHNCGRLSEVYLNRRGCPEHGLEGLYFDNTGRVRTARWRCRLCGDAEVDRLRQTPCRCEYSAHATSEHDRKLRFFSITDPAVFRSRVTPFINFRQEDLAPLHRIDARPLVLARTWGLLDQPVMRVLNQRDEFQAQTRQEPQLAAAIRALAELQPDHPLVQEWEQEQTTRYHPPGTNEIQQVYSLVRIHNNESLIVSRRMVEHVAILEALQTTTVPMSVERLRQRGDSDGATRLEAAAQYAMDELGIGTILAIENFPVGLCALGYTRVSAHPSDSILAAFPAVNGRTPLYVVFTSTEGLYFQLDPVHVVNWLYRNGIVEGRALSNAPEAWSWLYTTVPGLRQHPTQPEYNDPPAVAVRTLLHSISHVLLRHIEWSGYSPQSLGEYLMPESLACVLYANRYTDTKVGGLLTLFEQRLDLWLESVHQEGRHCLYDPFCRDEGGACVGCLFREYNCPIFNIELSRATLYGGPVPQEGKGALPFGAIQEGYWR